MEKVSIDLAANTNIDGTYKTIHTSLSFPGLALFDTKAEKSSWVLTASSVVSERNPEFAVDGNKQGSWDEANIFHSSPHKAYDWLQIDFGTTKLVKSVHLYG